MSRITTTLALAASGCFTLLGGTAIAAPAAPNFFCSATALSVAGAPGELAPVRANADPNAACADEKAGVPPSASEPALSASVNARTAFAETIASGEGGPTAHRTAVAQAGGEDLVAVAGPLKIEAQAVYSSVATGCVDGALRDATYSRVVGLKINGTPVVGDGEPIPVEGALLQLTGALAATPLSGLVKVELSKITGNAGNRTVEGARIELLGAAGGPVLTVSIGRVNSGAVGDVCALAGDGEGTNTTTLLTTVTTTGGFAPGANGGNTAGGSTTSATGRGGTTPPSTNTVVAKAPSTTTPNNGTNASRCAKVTAFFVAKGRNRVVGGFLTSGPSSLKSPFGVRQVVRGRVVSCAGKPIGKARIDVLHSIDGGRFKAIDKTGLRTRSDGRLTLILPLNLTTRKIQFRYRSNLASTRVAARRTLNLTVLDKKGKSVTLARRQALQRG